MEATSSHPIEQIAASPRVDSVGVEERAARFRTRSIKKESKAAGLRLALSMIDLTTLEGADTPDKVRHLCRKAQRPHEALPDLPTVAAVCVYPPFVEVAKRELGDSGVKVAAVATYFPSGQCELEARVAEVRRTVAAGADEIDMVISRGRFLSGEHAFTYDEVAATKAACGEARLKVILETGELGTLDSVRRASDLCIAAGADFIKTSTGKIKPAATMPVTLVMLQAIRDHYRRTGKMVAMKPAGGISDAKTALQYLVMVHETLGQQWLSSEWFRFGASRLANDLLRQIVRQESGAYQAGDYFSND